MAGIAARHLLLEAVFGARVWERSLTYMMHVASPFYSFVDKFRKFLISLTLISYLVFN